MLYRVSFQLFMCLLLNCVSLLMDKIVTVNRWLLIPEKWWGSHLRICLNRMYGGFNPVKFLLLRTEKVLASQLKLNTKLSGAKNMFCS